MLLSCNKLESSSYSLPPSKHKPLVAEITRVTASPRTQWHFLVLAIHLHECQDSLSFCVSFHKQTGRWWLFPEPEIARLLFQISIYLIFNNQTPIKCHAGRWYFYFVCSDWWSTAAKLTQHKETETAHTLCKQNTCFIQNGQSVHQNRVCTVELQSEYLVCLAMLPHHGSNFRKLENYCPRNLKQEKQHKEKGLKTIAQCTHWVMLSLVDLSKRESWFLSILFKCLKKTWTGLCIFGSTEPGNSRCEGRRGRSKIPQLYFLYFSCKYRSKTNLIFALTQTGWGEVPALYATHILTTTSPDVLKMLKSNNMSSLSQ